MRLRETLETFHDLHINMLLIAKLQNGASNRAGIKIERVELLNANDMYMVINYSRRQCVISNKINFLTFTSDFTCDISEDLIIKQRYQIKRSRNGTPKKILLAIIIVY